MYDINITINNHGYSEGITEFLPISSTGHMIIVGHFINFKGPYATLFKIAINRIK